MKYLKTILALSVALLSVAMANAVRPSTYVFDIENTDTLRLDVYRAEGCSEPVPALIFAFGGSFKHGNRADSRYVPFFDFLSDNGVTVVSTDYRTMLKDASTETMMSAQGFREALNDAIAAAVSDFLKATAFTVAHSGDWGVDSSLVFAAGSSAGAITALQAEHAICDTPVPFPFLPANFNYAGVISFSGALASDGVPQCQRRPAPMLLIQGDADAVVPFEKAVVGSFGLYGSKSISDCLSKAALPHRFIRINGAGHEVAVDGMTDYKGLVLDFIRSVAAGRETGMTKTVVINPSRTNYKTDFTLEDYLKANM